MFKEYIRHPIDPIPDAYIRTLKRITYDPDYSLDCLAIALLRPRIYGYSGITGIYGSYEKQAACVTDFLTRFSNIEEYPLFCYYIYNRSEDGEKQRLIERGFEIKESIGAFIKNKTNTNGFAAYHPIVNAAAFFVNSNDIKLYHVLLSFISLLYPSLFAEKPMTENDYELVKSLSKSDSSVFVRKIQEAVSPYVPDFRRLMLSNLVKAMHQAKIASAKNNVDSQRGYVNRAETDYVEAIKTLKNLIVVYEGLLATEKYDNVEEDLVEYLSTSKEIHNLNVRDEKIYFTVATLLNNYNENAWETFSNRGYIYDGNYKTTLLNVFNDRHNRKILLDNLFSESPDFAIKIAGNYSLDLNECRIRTDSAYDYEFADPLYKSYLPNPHLKLFACLGGYKDKVMRALREKNYIGAIQMCIASAGSVDLDETEQTFRPFLGWILSSTEKILKRTDGVEMTPEEALIYLVDKEKVNETD